MEPEQNQTEHGHSDHHNGHRFTDIHRLRSVERLERLEVERVIRLALTGLTVQSVVDIGTGTGVFAEEFARRGITVTGVDVNPEMLTHARQYVPNAGFREGAAEQLPFPDKSFDLAFLGLVLHETDDLPQALQEAFRVARQRAAVLEWPYQEQEFGPGMEERLQPEFVESLARRAGFNKIHSIPLKALVLYLLEKSATPE